MVKQNIKNEIKRLNRQLKPSDKGALIFEQNEDGTFGSERLTWDQLESYVIKNRYYPLIIDDIPKNDTTKD